jgi:hypothetical protein
MVFIFKMTRPARLRLDQHQPPPPPRRAAVRGGRANDHVMVRFVHTRTWDTAFGTLVDVAG